MANAVKAYKENAPGLSAAYQEMLDGCILNPAQYYWYCAWKILLKDNQEQIGDACFKGFNNGSPEIGYGINDAYWGRGYATEAVAALCEWAFTMPGVVAVEAEAEADNERSKRVLSKLGFAHTGKAGKEGPRHIKEKQIV